MPTSAKKRVVWRRLASGAVWHLALFGIWRISAFGAVSACAV